jgi:hypothetical protein
MRFKRFLISMISMKVEGNKIMRNEPMELIPVPAALLARRLRRRLCCQKQAGMPHRGGSANYSLQNQNNHKGAKCKYID